MYDLHKPHLLLNLLIYNLQAEYITAMFDFYDYNKSGTVPKHLAQKILLALGIEPSVIALPRNITCSEFISFCDTKLPEPDPVVEVLDFAPRLYTYT